MLLFFGAHTLAYNLIQIPEAELTLIALSPAIFFVAMSAVFRGYFTGQQDMKPTSVSQTLEQFLNCVLSNFANLT